MPGEKGIPGTDIQDRGGRRLMYLEPWQIFVFGCIVGVIITVIILVLIIARIVTHSGVAVIHEKSREESKSNGKEED